MSAVREAAEKWLTPSLKEQAKLLKKKECPHNNGWTFYCHGHRNSAYTCNLCGKVSNY